MPPVLIVSIFQFLHPREYNLSQLVCKVWYRMWKTPIARQLRADQTQTSMQVALTPIEKQSLLIQPDEHGGYRYLEKKDNKLQWRENGLVKFMAVSKLEKKQAETLMRHYRHSGPLTQGAGVASNSGRDCFGKWTTANKVIYECSHTFHLDQKQIVSLQEIKELALNIVTKGQGSESLSLNFDGEIKKRESQAFDIRKSGKWTSILNSGVSKKFSTYLSKEITPLFMKFLEGRSAAVHLPGKRYSKRLPKHVSINYYPTNTNEEEALGVYVDDTVWGSCIIPLIGPDALQIPKKKSKKRSANLQTLEQSLEM